MRKNQSADLHNEGTLSGHVRGWVLLVDGAWEMDSNCKKVDFCSRSWFFLFIEGWGPFCVYLVAVVAALKCGPFYALEVEVNKYWFATRQYNHKSFVLYEKPRALMNCILKQSDVLTLGEYTLQRQNINQRWLIRYNEHDYYIFILLGTFDFLML